jgi:hypothetical protein
MVKIVFIGGVKMYKNQEVYIHDEENTLEQIQEIRDLISEFQKDPNHETLKAISDLTGKLTNQEN